MIIESFFRIEGLFAAWEVALKRARRVDAVSSPLVLLEVSHLLIGIAAPIYLALEYLTDRFLAHCR